MGTRQDTSFQLYNRSTMPVEMLVCYTSAFLKRRKGVGSCWFDLPPDDCNIQVTRQQSIDVTLCPQSILSNDAETCVPPQVGIDVDHEAVPKMIVKYQALLDKMEASDMPADAQYRINVEKICRYRIKAAQENLDDPEKVEELCNCGQVEELVIQVM